MKPNIKHLRLILSSMRGILLVIFFILSFKIDSLGAHIAQAGYIIYTFGTVYLRCRLWWKNSIREKVSD